MKMAMTVTIIKYDGKVYDDYDIEGHNDDCDDDDDDDNDDDDEDDGGQTDM